MKILLATFWIVPHVGGIWQYMTQLRTKMISLGHEVDLLGYGELNKSVYIVNRNKRVERSSLLSLMTSIEERMSRDEDNDPLVSYCEKQSLFYELSAAELGLDQYDVIHTQDVFSTVCIKRVIPEKTRLIATLHGCNAHEMNHYLTHVHASQPAEKACEYFNQLEHDGAASSNLTIVANHWLKELLVNDFHVSLKQLRILHYGYDIDFFRKRMKKRTNVKRKFGKKVILFTGRLVHLKGVHILLEALSYLNKTRNDWECWIAGEGEKKSELLSYTKALGLDKKVTFLGKRTDIPALVYRAHISVLPSLIENQPLSVIEAQIAGKAVIVSDSGGLKEMVEHNLTGLVFSSGDAKGLASSIEELLKDKRKRKSLGKQAKKWGTIHWSMDSGVDRLIEIYKNSFS